jgi:hypothetical protein
MLHQPLLASNSKGNAISLSLSLSLSQTYAETHTIVIFSLKGLVQREGLPGILTAEFSMCRVVWGSEAWWQSFTFALQRMGGSILNIWHDISAKWPALSMSHGVAHTLAHCDCDDSDKLLSCHGKPTCKSQILRGFLPSLIFL